MSTSFGKGAVKASTLVPPVAEGPGTMRISILNRKHQEYIFYYKAWEMLDMLYKGGVVLQNNVDKFLIRRPKELYDVFYERGRRLTYQDILQSCISWHLSKLFQTQPIVDFKCPGDPVFSEFLEDCDLAGRTFSHFSSDMMEKMMLFGRTFVLIDKPNPKGRLNIVTRLDERNAGADRPYTLLFDPRNVINWSKDRFGNLNWVVIKTLEMEQETPISDVSVCVNWWCFDRTTFKQYQYRVPKELQDQNTDVYFNSDFTPTGSNTDALARLVDQGEHALSHVNKVPIIMSQLPVHLWHAMRAYLHLLEHVDAINGHSWKLFMSNLPQLVVYTENEVSGKTLSETGMIQLGPNDKIEWLEPKGSSFQESRLHINSTKQEIFRAFHLQAQARDASATADGASGYSKEVEMMPAIDVINALGDVLRGQMQRVCCAAKEAAVEQVTEADRPDVSGFNFETKPTLRNIEKYTIAGTAGILKKSPTLERTVAVDIAMDMVDGKNDSLRETITNEIMTAPVSADDPSQGVDPNLDKELKARQDRSESLTIVKNSTDAGI